MRFFGLFVVGTVAFVVISYFEQVPVLGWLGAVVSVVGWVTLSRSLARGSASSMLTAGMLGAWAGFVGASFRVFGATLRVGFLAPLRAAGCFAPAVFCFLRRPAPPGAFFT